MKKTLLTACAILGLGISACTEAPVERPWNNGINIIPQPVELQVGKGSFTLTNSTSVNISNAEVKSVGAFFAEKLSKNKMQIRQRKATILPFPLTM